MKVPSRFPKDEQLQASTGSLQILQRGWGCRMLRGLEPLLENRPAVLAFLHRKKQSSGGPPALPGLQLLLQFLNLAGRKVVLSRSDRH